MFKYRFISVCDEIKGSTNILRAQSLTIQQKISFHDMKYILYHMFICHSAVLFRNPVCLLEEMFVTKFICVVLVYFFGYPSLAWDTGTACRFAGASAARPVLRDCERNPMAFKRNFCLGKIDRMGKKVDQKEESKMSEEQLERCVAELLNCEDFAGAVFGETEASCAITFFP